MKDRYPSRSLLRHVVGRLGGKAVVALGAAVVVTAALAGPAAVADAATAPAHQVAQQRLGHQVTGYVEKLSSGRYDAVLAGPSRIRQASPVTFSTQAAASGYLSRVGELLRGKPIPAAPGGIRPDWSISVPCPFTCGADSNGGANFWVIASYQQIADVVLEPAFFAACRAYLTPIIGEGGAIMACAAAWTAIDSLALHQPPVSNHGVWITIYLSNPMSPSFGRY